MSTLMVTTLMLLVPLLCWVAAPLARNRAAFWILRVGGLWFSMGVAASLMASGFCAGDPVNGYTACGGPGFVQQIFNTLVPGIIFTIVAYLSIGPVLLVIALLLEGITRFRSRRA